MRTYAALALLLAQGAFAQSPTDVFTKAPPGVEEALKARVAVFLQAHVDGKFRLAERAVHEDALDAFYNSEKQKLISFEPERIDFSENFSKAMVIYNVELDWVTARVGKIRVKPPMKMLWKLDKGDWWWYVVPKGEWDTPFGSMKSGKESETGPSAPAPIRIPDAQTLLNQLKVDKTTLSLKSADKSEDMAIIRNEMPGQVTLALEEHSVAGLKVTLSKTTLKQGDTSEVRFAFTPPDRSAKTARVVYVRASPVGRTFSFALDFSVPPELQQYIPKQAPLAPDPEKKP